MSQDSETNVSEYTIKHPRLVTTEETCMLYRGLAELPILENGGILAVKGEKEKLLSCYGMFSQIDLETNKKRKFEKQYCINYEEGKGKNETEPKYRVESPSILSEVREVSCQTYSVDGTMKALIRTVKVDKNEQEYLEIWSSDRLVKNVNLTAVDVHGKVYSNGSFASFSISDDNEKVLYIAEKKKTPSQTYFERKSGHKKESDATTIGDKFVYQEDWGEQMVGQSQPVIAIFEICKGHVNVLSGVPDDISPGQACWGPDNSIIFTGWKNVPSRLGLVYCDNRVSALYQLKLNDTANECIQLSESDRSVNAPRVSPKKTKVVFLERDALGPHRGCERLMLYDFATSSCSILYDIVQANPFSKDSKIGIYAHNLPKRCWLEGDCRSHIVLDTFCGISKSIVSVCVETKKMSLLGILMEESCQTLLDVYEGFALFSSSATNSIPELCVVYINAKDLNNDDSTFHGTLLSIDNPVKSRDPFLSATASDIERKLVQAVVTVTLGEHGKFESVFLRPSGNPDEKPPLIAWVHGGPHSLLSATYILYATVFCYHGYCVLLVNYRGSTGFGEASLLSLLGKVGDQDVKDCQYVIEHTVDNFNIDSNNVFLFGGSHGGFLTTHLIGQHPDYYRCAAVRNPVINIASMVDSTDIPDWTLVESGYGYKFESFMTGDQCKHMFEISPIAHISRIKTPLLIMIGEEDRRVPPFQGIYFHRQLKNLGKESKLLVYPENSHPISKVEAEADVFVNVCKWFKKHMK